MREGFFRPRGEKDFRASFAEPLRQLDVDVPGLGGVMMDHAHATTTDDASCSTLGHDLNVDASECRRCGLKAEEHFRLLKFPVYFSPFTLFFDGLGDLGRKGVWYVRDPRRGFVVVSWGYEDAVACSDALEQQVEEPDSVTLAARASSGRDTAGWLAMSWQARGFFALNFTAAQEAR